jgi:hypothetical protein
MAAGGEKPMAVDIGDDEVRGSTSSGWRKPTPRSVRCGLMPLSCYGLGLILFQKLQWWSSDICAVVIT